MERTFGLLKARFRGLNKTGGALMYAPLKVCRIVVACCMLHNLALHHNIPVIGDDGDQGRPEDDDSDGASEAGSGEDEDVDTRRELVAGYFT